MSNLKDLVPDFELCKKIPTGEFEDSVLVWGYSCDKRNTEPFVDERDCVEHCRRNMVNAPPSYPAPTLQEILENLTTLCVTPEIFHAHKNYWTAQGEKLNDEGMYQFYHGYSHNSATAAFKLWLKLKGIEA